MKLNQISLLWTKYFTDKKVEMNHKDSAQKVHKKVQKAPKSSLNVQIFMSIITQVFCFISLVFDYQWNTSISSFLKPFSSSPCFYLTL